MDRPGGVSAEDIQMHDGIHIHDDVLTVEDCRELIAAHESERHQGYIDHLTITRFADLATPHAIHLALPMIRARHVCLETVEMSFGEHFELYPEFTAIMAWHAGSYLKTHNDANREYLQDRHYSAILYLNDPEYDSCDGGAQGERHEFDGFVGGDLVFELPNSETDAFSVDDDDPDATTTPSSGQERLRISPKAGRLVCFPSNHRYPHRVDEITSGTRYALTLWFTKNEQAMETLESCRLLQSDGPLEGALREAASALLVKDHDEQDYTSSDRTSKRQKCVPETTSCAFRPEQPWETPDQAKALLHKTMIRANLVWDAHTQAEYVLPTPSSSPSHHVNDHGTNHHLAPPWSPATLKGGMQPLASSTTTELTHIVAHCQNKQGRFALTREDLLDGDDDESKLVRGWRQYVHRRRLGLQSASKRWRTNGIITNVTAQELSLGMNAPTYIPT